MGGFGGDVEATEGGGDVYGGAVWVGHDGGFVGNGKLKVKKPLDEDDGGGDGGGSDLLLGGGPGKLEDVVNMSVKGVALLTMSGEVSGAQLGKGR